MSDNGDYGDTLHALQIELVKLQRTLIGSLRRLVIVFEGRDGAGKDGSIKRITEHMSPRETRIVALGKPSDRETTQWYFQRFVPHMPAAGEIVIFNRSWYNRAGVEPVMGFCSEAETESFLDEAPVFERMLTREGIELRKYFLDITRAEQKERLAARRRDPLKQWKISPVDAAAMKKFDAYTVARDTMFVRTSHEAAPWNIVRADHKKTARLAIIRDLLAHVPYRGRDRKLATPETETVFAFEAAALSDGRLAR